MKTGIPPLVIGNWKMNPQSVSLGKKLGTELKKRLASVRDVDVVVAPPFPYLETLATVKGSSRTFLLGAQNVFPEKLGSFTGEVSLPMLQSFGVTHVMLGHSERRKNGERDEEINLKLNAVVRAGLVGVVCVGEQTRDGSGHYLTHIETQIRTACAKLGRAKLGNVVIAYEPVWAIGTGENATPDDVHEMRLFIEKVLSDMYGRNFAQKVRIIYGGSVNGKNARELFTLGTVGGFLVGGASLHPADFVEIVTSVRNV